MVFLAGSAAHAHLSLRSSIPASSASADIDSAPALSQLEASFLEGLLQHLPAVCAFSLPLAASYRRVVDGAWSGGTYVAWGRDNRETPIRLCGFESDYHFEVKCNDGTANPYLSLAALLSAGMLGVRANLKLSVGHSNVAPAKMSENERQKIGVKARMPLNVEDAQKNLRQDKELIAELGEEFVRIYLSAHEVREAVPRLSSSIQELTTRTQALKPQLARETADQTLKKLIQTF